MDNIILYKVIVILTIVGWGWSMVRRKQKKQVLEPAIAQANARSVISGVISGGAGEFCKSSAVFIC